MAKNQDYKRLALNKMGKINAMMPLPLKKKKGSNAVNQEGRKLLLCGETPGESGGYVPKNYHFRFTVIFFKKWGRPKGEPGYV